MRSVPILAILMAGCTPAAQPPAPPARPSAFVAHAEPPISDYLNRRLVRTMAAALDRLEPEWGELQGRVYTVAPGARDLAGLVQGELPKGWQRVDLKGFQPRGGELVAWHAGDALYAVLLVDPGSDPVTPVMVLRNDATLALGGGQ